MNLLSIALISRYMAEIACMESPLMEVRIKLCDKELLDLIAKEKETKKFCSKNSSKHWENEQEKSSGF